jgi:signal transduction histidine kinase
VQLFTQSMKDNTHTSGFSQKSLTVIMLLSLVVLIIAVFLSYSKYAKTLEDYQVLSHTNEVMRDIANLKITIRETESQARSYVILRRSRVKLAMKDRRRAAMVQLQTVILETEDNVIQQRNCERMRVLIDKRFDYLESVVNRVEPGRPVITFEDAEINTAMAVMEQLDELLNVMYQHEAGLLAQRTVIVKSGVRLTPVFLLIASFISVILIIGAYFVIINALNQSIELQHTLAHKVKDLNRSNNELEQFAYVASHDLQEPLRKLRTFGDMLQLKESESLSEEGRELILRMQGFAAKMQKLIEDLLTFSRVVNNNFQLKEIDLNRVVNDVKANIALINNSRKVILSVPHLPVVLGFDTQLFQLFQNILSNSVKYAKATGDIRIVITCTEVKGDHITDPSADKEEIFYKISIKDNGIGFDSQYAQKIFVIFQRLHGKSEYEGTGIGLSICKRVVENHSGYIEAKGQPDQGAEFIIYLPKPKQ